MPGESPNQLWVDSRTALLDVLEALGDHAERVVLVGAQAIYLRCEDSALSIAPFTKDADIALIPPLGTEPALEAAMRAAGLELRAGQHGIWVREGAEVDLLVPDALAPPEGKRGARLMGHDPRAARKVVGLEGAAVDWDLMQITGLAPGDRRTASIRVAGPAALLVAKVYKIAEKGASPALNKDAHDVYRLLVATDTGDLARRVRMLLDDPVTGRITETAIGNLRRLFGDPFAPGSLMAGAAEAGVGNPANVQASLSALANDLLQEVSW